MGCDIHSVLQIKRAGKWKTVATDVFEDNRNYRTFACLANVRNGVGFAGLDTGDGYEPIFEPRGLPADFELNKDELHPLPKKVEHPHDDEERAIWMGDHSHSWITLDELEKYFKRVKNKTTNLRGIISAEQYLALRDLGKRPKSYSSGIYGPGIVVVDSEDFDRMTSIHEGLRIFVRYQWKETYEESTDLAGIINSMKSFKLCRNLKSESVRYVFGFDS